MLRLFATLYEIALHLYALAMVPTLFLSKKKLYKTALKRLGKDFPFPQNREGPLIWVHAVSVGEVRAVQGLIRAFKAQKKCTILLTTVTATGYQEGLKSIPEANLHAFLPFDFRYIIRPIVKKVAPTLVLFCETDLWYNFIRAAKKAGALVAVVNGKLSERTFHRYARFPFLVPYMLGQIDHFFVQGETYAERLHRLGIDRTTITGNLKLDGKTPQKTPSNPSVYTVTIGSTHAPEERIWIEALKKLWVDFPSLRAYLVPRHPERFDEVAGLLTEASIPFSRYSEGGDFTQGAVVLVDAMGVLLTCYAESDLAFVGGSFTPKVGGHNILEPALFGKPVLFGPYMQGQPDLMQLVHQFQAGLQIEKGEIVSVVKRVIQKPAMGKEWGENGRRLLEASRGALEKSLDGLERLQQMQGAC